LFRQTSWSPRHELDLPEWIDQGRRLGALGRASNWWLGDWVRYGNARYGERYEVAARITGYEVQSLMNMAYVASRFAISRRRETASWSHHAELAALAPPDQDLWLDRVEREQLSVLALRIERRVLEGRPERQAISAGSGRSARAAKDADEAGEGASTDAEPVVCPNCGHGFDAES
jgi:hypothetical protein